MPEDLISLEEAALIAHSSTATIARWRREGRLVAYARGRRALVSRGELERLVAPVRVERGDT